jgi:hypothetical protein
VACPDCGSHTFELAKIRPEPFGSSTGGTGDATRSGAPARAKAPAHR